MWLAAFACLVAVGLAVVVILLERQMRAMAHMLAARQRAGEQGEGARRVRLGFPTPASRELAYETNRLIGEVEGVRIQADEERRLLQENLASFSHDVRTPLAGAQGYLQLYAVAGDDAERNECVEAAAERLGAMRELVDALFEYAKAVDDDRDLVPEDVDVGEVVTTCLSELYPAFVERGWSPAVDIAEGVTAWTDRAAFARIVENLLVNCLRHGTAAPTIVLARTDAEELRDGRRAESEPNGEATAASASVSFRLVVSNSADGLDAVDPARLFDRFYRGDPSRRAGGSGLGLAIAAGLASALNMRLTASVAVDTFSVTLESTTRG